jgi:hypothetical protein
VDIVVPGFKEGAFRCCRLRAGHMFLHWPRRRSSGPSEQGTGAGWVWDFTWYNGSECRKP